ncbi:MAG: hypothetical protein QGF69_05785, partial [Candidatus Marinimicrobia bacterium]|nr:hypothetical protein [Candidatus Neomarinimicrobiota bacterium]
TALDMDADNDEYEGYASSTEFIGFTFMDGPDDEPLINIVGPGISSSLDWAPTFTNCRFINSSITDLGGEDHGVIDIEDAEPVFNNCEFRNLSIDPNNSSTGTIKGPIRLASTGSDSTAFRSQFNNCTIAGNYTHFQNPQYSQYDFKGGAVYVGWGALPTFKDCRIDSNEIDTKSGASGWGDAWNAAGGAVYIDGFLSYSSSPVRFINTLFNGNQVFGENVYGGAIASNHPQVNLVNCVVVNNKISSGYTNNDNDENVVAFGGGIVFNPDSYYQSGQVSAKLVIINSTIAENELVPYIFSNDQSWRQGAYGGAGIFRQSSDNNVLMFNSIVYGNTIDGGSGYNNRLSLSSGGSEWGDDETAIDYSIIEHADSTGLGDLDDYDFLSTVNPRFSSATNYALSDTSAAIGAGTGSFENLSAPVYDINNSTRPGSDGGDPDIGAYEHSKAVTPFPASPANLTVSAVGDSFVTIMWDEVDASDLEYYRIYRGTLKTSLSV